MSVNRKKIICRNICYKIFFHFNQGLDKEIYANLSDKIVFFSQ